MKTENKQLDKVNNDRVTTTKFRVAHAIRILENPIECLVEGRLIDTAINDIAHAINLLEAASQELEWACQHFEWDESTVDLIENACGNLGMCLASLVHEDNAEDCEDSAECISMAGYNGKTALASLSKALATLVRWFDDDVDVSEV